MSGPLSKSLGVCSALNITEEAMVTNKQGIGSILGSDTNQTTTTKVSSLRRTLSADMSSKKWLSQQVLSPLKRIASSHQFPACSIIDSSSSSSDECYEERKELENNKKPGQFDMWSSIISQKADEDSSKSVLVPYVHPLVKKTNSALSEKSLEICTESLGSETGSDGFSSNTPSETGDMQEDDHKEEEQDHVEEPRIVKHHNNDVCKKSTHNPSFPPPIPSLSRENGASVRIKTHRANGRLVLEAVSMPSKNNFVALRQDGRLVLTFTRTTPSTEEDDVAEFEEEFEKESEINNIDEGDCCEMEQAPKLSIGAMNVHRLAVIINKPIWSANRNPTWPIFFDDIVKLGEDKVEPTTKTPPPQLLPQRPPKMAARPIPSTPPSTTTATSFNAYEYYWRRPNQAMSKNLKAYNNDQQQQLVVLVPLSKGCKEPRRSLLFWEPYCIATTGGSKETPPPPKHIKICFKIVPSYNNCCTY